VKIRVIICAALYLAAVLLSLAGEPEPPQWVKDQNGLFKDYVSVLIKNGTVTNEVEKKVLKGLERIDLIPGPIFFLGYVQRIDMIKTTQGVIDPKVDPAKKAEPVYGDEGEARAQAWRTPLISYYDDTIDNRHVGIYVFARESHLWAYTDFGNRLWSFRTPTQVCIIVTDFKTDELLSWTHREQEEMPEKRVYRAEDHTLILTDRMDGLLDRAKVESYRIGLHKIEEPH
jgi:hypothetical protein